MSELPVEQPQIVPPPPVVPIAPVVRIDPVFPSPVPVSMPVKKFPVWLLLLIPTLVVAAVIGVYVMLQARTMYEEAKGETIVVPPPDITEGWEKYVNDKTKTSLKYPKDSGLQVFEYPANELTFSLKKQQYDPPFFDLVLLPNTELQDWYQKAYDESGDKNEMPPLTPGEIIDGHASYISDFDLVGLGEIRYIFVQVGTDLYQIFIPISENSLQYQILSTLKFTNSAIMKEEVNIEQSVQKHVFEYSQSYGVQTIDQIMIRVVKSEGNYATGIVNFADDIEGSGSVWFAVKLDGVWTVVEETQEPPSCSIMTEYEFPTTLYKECIEK
jgi:hypothetical protein